jgi:subtilisin-like proprotein convertase family protein
LKLKNILAAATVFALIVLGAVGVYAAVSQSSTNVPVAIPDNGSTNSTLNFTVAGTITDANVQVSITHTWDSDVRTTLASPTVAAQTLWANCGGSSDNFTNTIIDADAATPIPCTCTSQAICNAFTGTFNNTSVVAAGSMNAFDTTASNGTWTLNVADDSAICTGTLTAWSLTLDGAQPLPVELLEFQVGS